MNRSIWLVASAAIFFTGCEALTGEEFDPLFDGDESLLVASYGSIELSGNDSEPVKISVPEDATSMAVVLSGLGNVLAQPAIIKNPNGEIVFEVGTNTASRSDAYSQVATTLLPVNPDVGFFEGEWEFTFFAESETSAQVEALVRVDTSTSSGTLDLNVHFVGVDGLDASSAAEDPEFQAVMSTVSSIYGGAGISIGETLYFDVDDDQYAVLETTQTGSGELLSLLQKHTTARDNRAVNLFFVADIENPTSARSLLGVSGGVPGPAALHGTARSGVAISTANFVAARDGAGDLQGASDEMALVVAHEIGHYLGLFHTTEANGAELSGGLNGSDPIADTPLCDDGADANGDNALSSAECSGADGSNLMFWSPPNSARTLTSGQKTILRRNPVVR